jgi:hypothetical protein
LASGLKISSETAVIISQLQNNTDTPVLLTKNNIKAIRSLIFSIVRKVFDIKKNMDRDFLASCVDLRSVLVWAIREQCLYSDNPQEIEFNIKLDGRPLGGMLL